MNSKSKNVTNWQRRTKIKLVNHFGGKCIDCGFEGPPYVFDFDHRDPSQKEFAISQGIVSYEKLLKEAEKCDLVCSNCHRHRTHIQRCQGCEFCSDELVQPYVYETKTRVRRGPNFCGCGKKIDKKSRACLTCSGIARSKIDWPPTNELVNLIRDKGFLKAGLYLGVSDNSIRKHLTKKGVDIKKIRRNTWTGN